MPLTSLPKQYLFGFLLITWMVVIFAFSSIPGAVSPYASPLWYVLERKGAHVFEYLILAVLAMLFLGTHPRLQKECHSPYWIAFLFCTSYALSDEIHQFFVFGRQARFTDVLIDVIGVVCGMAFFFLWKQKKIRTRLLKVYRFCKVKTSR